MYRNLNLSLQDFEPKAEKGVGMKDDFIMTGTSDMLQRLQTLSLVLLALEKVTKINILLI